MTDDNERIEERLTKLKEEREKTEGTVRELDAQFGLGGPLDAKTEDVAPKEPSKEIKVKVEGPKKESGGTWHWKGYGGEKETFEVKDAYGFLVPKLYEKKAEDLTKFIAEAGTKSASGKVLTEQDARRLWAGTFINNSTGEQAECLRILREQIDMGLQMGGEKYLDALKSGVWGFASPHSGVAKELEDKKDSPLARFAKEKVIVVSNMVASMPTTPLVVRALESLGEGPVPYVLAGNSKNGETKFEDGKKMVDDFYVPPSELKTLEANKDRVAIVVDDTEITGKTYTVVREGLQKIGFTKIYKITTCDGNLLDEKGKSLNNRGGVTFYSSPTSYINWNHPMGFAAAYADDIPRGYVVGKGSEKIDELEKSTKTKIAIIGGEDFQLDKLPKEAGDIWAGTTQKMARAARALGAALAENGVDVVTRSRNDHDASEFVTEYAKRHGGSVYFIPDRYYPRFRNMKIPEAIVNVVKKENKFFDPSKQEWMFEWPNAVVGHADAVVLMGWNPYTTLREFASALAQDKVIGVLDTERKATKKAKRVAEAVRKDGRDIVFSADPQELVKEVMLKLAKRKESRPKETAGHAPEPHANTESIWDAIGMGTVERRDAPRARDRQPDYIR